MKQFTDWIIEKLNQITEPYNQKVDNNITDEITGDNYSLAGLCSQLAKHVKSLEDRIVKLERENISNTNEIYELHNIIDTLFHTDNINV